MTNSSHNIPIDESASVITSDLFLSYNNLDRELIERIRLLLIEKGITTYLDRENNTPGLPWFDIVQGAINATRAVAIFLGENGLSPWQKREMQLALERQVKEERQGNHFLVIPVLLTGVDLDRAPGFLLLNSWVDLRKEINNPDALDILIKVIKGEGPLLPKSTTVLCPYRALRPFREEDAELFFGRETFSEELLDKTLRCSLVAVVGSSGIGKSSIVQAGLLPLLRLQRPPSAVWDVITFSPGTRPFHNLAAVLVPAWESSKREVTQRLIEAETLGGELASGNVALSAAFSTFLKVSLGTDRLLVVIDQFEQIFRSTSDAECQQFIRALMEVGSQVPVTILLVIRADFYGQAIGLSRELSDKIQQGLVNLGPMKKEELEQTIINPAKCVGLEFEPGLVARIVEHLEGQPGNLPLLEFALTELWERRQGTYLTNKGYDDIGRVDSAISKSAEEQFARLSRDQQPKLLRFLTRLVRVSAASEEGADILQRVRLSEADDSTRQAVNSFVNARLLVVSRDSATNEETVEMAHEALIRVWDRIKKLVNDDREFLLWRQRLNLRVDEWQQTGEDTGSLLRGALLADARRLLKERGRDFTNLEREFIQRSESAARRLRQWKLRVAVLLLLLAAVAISIIIWTRSNSYQVNIALSEANGLTASSSSPAINTWVKTLTFAGKSDVALAVGRNISDPKLRAEVLADIADILIKVEKIDVSRKVIDEALAIAPEIDVSKDPDETFTTVARVLINTRNTTETIATAHRVENLNSRTQVLIAISKALTEAGKNDAAKLVLDDALSTGHLIEDPADKAQNIVEVAELFAKIDKIDEAKRVSGEALAIVPQISDAGALTYIYSKLADVHFKLGDINKGKEITNLAFKMLQRADSMQRSLNSSDVLNLLVKAGRTEEALNEAIVMIRHGETGMKYSPLLAIISDMVEADKTNEALDILSKINGLSEYDHLTIQYMGYYIVTMNFVTKGKTDEALNLMRTLDPKMQQPIYLSIVVGLAGMEKMEKVDEALRLASGVEGVQDNPLLLLLVLPQLAHSKKTDEALTMARRIEDPNIKAIALASITISIIKFEKSDKIKKIIDEALATAERATEEQSRDVALVVVAAVQAELKDFRAAIKTAERCSSSNAKIGVYSQILSEHTKQQFPKLTPLIEAQEEEEEEEEEGRPSIKSSFKFSN